MADHEKKPQISILRGQKRTIVVKWGITITFMLFLLVSCSKLVNTQHDLPEKIKYSNIEFEPCAYSGSNYVCLKNLDATNLVLEFKQCQEQNKLLRELYGN
jgi:hypothetical protein